MAHSDWLDPIAVSNPCPAPMTRGALLALRAANALRTECPYIITDHVQNRLVAGTTITMRAVSTNELSEQVEVNTTYDNEAWAGIYDLDRALVLELTDNRGNVAKGINGTEVANFDWGNAAYTGCRVENATWTVTYGNAAQMLRVSVYGGASLNTTGFTGTMQDNAFHTAVTVNFSGANGSWRYSEWWGGGSFNASGYTGGGDNYYNEFNLPAVDISTATGQVTLRVNEIVAGSLVVRGASPFSLQNSALQNHVINRAATGGSFVATQLSCTEAGSIGHSGAGTLTMTGVQNNGNVNLTGAGALTVVYCSVGQSCSIAHAGLGTLSMTRTTLQGASSNVTVDAGSNKAVTVNDCTLRSTGIVRVVGAIAGGAFTVTTTVVESTSYIYHRGTGTLTVTQSELSGSSGIDAQSGDRSYNFTRANLRAVSRITLTGTGAVTDTISDLDMGERGSVNISCSGPANSILYCMFAGLSGTLSLSGTTGSQAISRLRGFEGSFSFVNCTVNLSAQLSMAADFGQISFNNVATAKTCRYLEATNNSRITINNSTGGGTNSAIRTTGGGDFIQSGAAASAQSVTISQGAVSHNGGSLSTCDKTLGGTLTTGNFNHLNITHQIGTSRTLTAANANRGEYVGLGPAAYAPGGQLI